MSSKFFTWTKGDRKHAAEALRSGGVVPIPVECISFKGLDVSKKPTGASRSPSRPSPLLGYPPSEGLSKDLSSPDSSVALHDAAVQSATSLMAVMNDMLRSPHLSAHLRERSATRDPLHGRPRSHTAPSTPLCEAPSMEPVELLGSVPPDRWSQRPLHDSVSGGGVNIAASISPSVLGHSIERPHTSPQRVPDPSLCRLARSSESVSRGSGRESGPCFFDKKVRTSLDEGGAIDSTEPAGRAASSLRPSLSILQPWPSDRSAASQTQRSTQSNGTSSSIPVTIVDASSHVEVIQQEDSEVALLRQISSMRAAQEAHLSSLRDAHDKEVASHLGYIAFLERRRLTAHPVALLPDHSSKQQNLTIDTSQATRQPAELPTADISANTLRSFESSLENQRRASEEAIAEAESLRRKLSICRKSQVESSEIRRERDRLRHSLEQSDRRVLQLKDIVQKAKENEKTLKNTVDKLDAQLLEANNQRIDVLEGFQDACAKVDLQSKREMALLQEVDDLHSGLIRANPSSTSLGSSTSDKMHGNTRQRRSWSDLSIHAWNNDPLVSQVRELRRLLSNKDANIMQLERERAERVRRPEPYDRARLDESENMLQKCQQALVKAEEDRDQYNSLLHNEVRRQSRTAAQKSHATTPKIEAEAFAAMHDKLVGARAAFDESSGASDRTPPDKPDNLSVTLERELEHCIKEIILYKLDVRGYKKDLRRAHAEINGLRAALPLLQRPPTPDRDSNASAKSDSGPGGRRGRPGNGFDNALGISLAPPPPPATPTRTVASATVEALLAATPPAMPEMPTIPTMPTMPLMPMASPPHRPKTPLSTHKKLPKPPASPTASPPAETSVPAQGLARGETLRSLSESILSSYYAGGSPPAGQSAASTPSRRPSRRSDPLGVPRSRMSNTSSSLPSRVTLGGS